jgi:hypothetical protein
MYVVIGEEFIAGLEHETDRVVESNNSVLRVGFTALSQELPVASRGARKWERSNHYAVRHGPDVRGRPSALAAATVVELAHTASRQRDAKRQRPVRRLRAIPDWLQAEYRPRTLRSRRARSVRIQT